MDILEDPLHDVELLNDLWDIDWVNTKSNSLQSPTSPATDNSSQEENESPKSSSIQTKLIHSIKQLMDATSITWSRVQWYEKLMEIHHSLDFTNNLELKSFVKNVLAQEGELYVSQSQDIGDVDINSENNNASSEPENIFGDAQDLDDLDNNSIPGISYDNDSNINDDEWNESMKDKTIKKSKKDKSNKTQKSMEDFESNIAIAAQAILQSEIEVSWIRKLCLSFDISFINSIYFHSID